MPNTWIKRVLLWWLPEVLLEELRRDERLVSEIVLISISINGFVV